MKIAIEMELEAVGVTDLWMEADRECVKKWVSKECVKH